MKTQTNIRPAAIITLIALALTAATAPAAERPGRDATATTEPANPKPFTSLADGFSMTFPATWEEVHRARVVVIFMEPQDGEADAFRENVTVTVIRIPPRLNFDAFAKGVIAGLGKSLTGFKLISSEKVTLGSLPAQRLVAEHNAGGNLVKALIYFCVNDDRAYSITCTAAPADYVKHEPVFEDICKTLRAFTPAQPKPQPFVSETDGFSITPPAGWDKQEGVSGTAVIFLQPQTSESDKFRENVNVVVENIQPGMNLDAYVKANMEALGKALAEFKLVIGAGQARQGRRAADNVQAQDGRH